MASQEAMNPTSIGSEHTPQRAGEKLSSWPAGSGKPTPMVKPATTNPAQVPLAASSIKSPPLGPTSYSHNPYGMTATAGGSGSMGGPRRQSSTGAPTGAGSAPQAPLVSPAYPRPGVTSPTAAPPRLLFRWDPYNSSLHEDSTHTVDGDRRGAASASSPAAAAHSPASATMGSAGGGIAQMADESLFGSPHSQSLMLSPKTVQVRQTSSTPYETPRGVGSYGTSNPNTGTAHANSVSQGSLKTAPLKIEDLLAESPHLTFASPTNGSPGLVAVDKRALSNTKHQNDGRQYLLDYTPVLTHANPGSSGYSMPSSLHQHLQQQQQPQQQQQQSMQAARESSTSTFGATPGHHPRQVGVGQNTIPALFGEVMPSLQLPDQEQPMETHHMAQPYAPVEAVTGSYTVAASGPQDVLAYGDVAPVTVTGMDGMGGMMGMGGTPFPEMEPYAEDREVVSEIHATPSAFICKMLPPPPPVTLLLEVCSLQSVYMSCCRYCHFINSLMTGDNMATLSDATVAAVSGRPSPPLRSRDKGRRGQESATAAPSSGANAPPPVAFTALERVPPLPGYAVDNFTEMGATHAALRAWYGDVVRWWNMLHDVGPTSPAPQTATSAGARAKSGSHKSSPETANLKVAGARGGAPVSLRIDHPSPSVQSAIKAVVSGTMHRTDYGGGGGGRGRGGGGNNHSHSYGGHGNRHGGSGGYRGGRSRNGGGGSYSSGGGGGQQNYYYGRQQQQQQQQHQHQQGAGSYGGGMKSYGRYFNYYGGGGDGNSGGGSGGVGYQGPW